jgi:hypothetical protein
MGIGVTMDTNSVAASKLAGRPAVRLEMRNGLVTMAYSLAQDCNASC